MPLTAKGTKIMKNMKTEYGAKKGKEVFYASQNKGTIKGTHKSSAALPGGRIAALMAMLRGVASKAKGKAVAGGKRYGDLMAGGYSPTSTLSGLRNRGGGMGYAATEAAPALQSELRKVIGTRAATGVGALGIGSGIAGSMGDKQAAYRAGFQQACERQGVDAALLWKRAQRPQ